MLSMFDRRLPSVTPVVPEVSSFEVLLNEIGQWLKRDDINEIYLDCVSGIRAQSTSFKSMPIELNWSQDQILEFLLELAWACKVRIDPFLPYGGGVIPNFPWRWHAVIPPISPRGPNVVLRRQRFDVVQLEDFECENFSFEELFAEISNGKSLLIFGATGSGKSTFLLSFLKKFFSERRVGIAESTVELPMLSPHWFKLVAVQEDTSGRGGVDFSSVLSEMMRMSPETIVLGEIRGKEAKYFIDFARTGHGGVLSTIHAGSMAEAVARMEELSQSLIKEMPPVVGVQVQRLEGSYRLKKFELSS